VGDEVDLQVAGDVLGLPVAHQRGDLAAQQGAQLGKVRFSVREYARLTRLAPAAILASDNVVNDRVAGPGGRV